MDVVSMILGVVMILVVAYVMVVSNPPYGDALVHTFAPEHPVKLILPIITLVGGTVGGYITFRCTQTFRFWYERERILTICKPFCYWYINNWYYENIVIPCSIRSCGYWSNIKPITHLHLYFNMQ